MNYALSLASKTHSIINNVNNNFRRTVGNYIYFLKKILQRSRMFSLLNQLKEKGRNSKIEFWLSLSEVVFIGKFWTIRQGMVGWLINIGPASSFKTESENSSLPCNLPLCQTTNFSLFQTERVSTLMKMAESSPNR